MVYKANVVLPPGIHGLAQHLYPLQLVGRQLVLFGHDLFQAVMAVQSHPDVIDSELYCHSYSPAVRCRPFAE